MDLDLEAYCYQCRDLVEKVGIALMDFWNRPDLLSIKKKSDGSPATAADLAAHQSICSDLQKINPELPILSEEGQWPDYQQRSNWRTYWLIDPLDGTRGFIGHLEQFSINIALINNHQPVLGIIYSPFSKTIYFAWQSGGAFKQVDKGNIQRISSLQKQSDVPWRVVIGQYSRGLRLTNLIKASCDFQLLHVNGSVKFGWLAEGQADVYPRFGGISEWDTAAGQCILSESGGIVVDLQGRTLQYNRKASLLNPDFVALANKSWMTEWLVYLNKKV